MQADTVVCSSLVCTALNLTSINTARSAIPATVVANGQQLPMVEINFLCVHKKLRSKRLAPVMIKVGVNHVACMLPLASGRAVGVQGGVGS